MLQPLPRITDDTVQKQLRALNQKHHETVEAMNHAQASLNRAMKLNEQNYHRRRKAILANGHNLDE